MAATNALLIGSINADEARICVGQKCHSMKEQGMSHAGHGGER
jgi:hypothetical protein